MRAIIDIGTNSVRLLIADKAETGEWKVIDKELNPSRLGEGMADTASIAEGPRKRTLEAIEAFVKKAKDKGVSDIRAYGTSIMRDAAEGTEFAREIEDKTGVPVRILSGKEEAFYSYIGAAGPSGALTSVVDIGGGSTEICMGFGADIGLRHSFHLGCVRCSKQFDTTTARGLAELKKHCFELFSKTDILQKVEPVKRWICVGGTATSIAAMLLKLEKYDPSKVQGYVLHEEQVSDLLQKLYAMSFDERTHVKGLPPDRADIIVAGTDILDSVMEYFALPEITVSDRDLSEGLLDADVIKPKEEEDGEKEH